MLPSYTAIDFETAQGKRWSICQVGLVRLENGVVTAKLNRLVCPPHNEYHFRNTQVHGLSAAHTCKSPTFPEVWRELKPYIQNQTVVAHNGAFDFSCLKMTLEYYGLPQPEYEKQCTYKIYRKGLSELCREHQITLQHHDALSDALACAQLYWRYLKR